MMIFLLNPLPLLQATRRLYNTKEFILNNAPQGALLFSAFRNCPHYCRNRQSKSSNLPSIFASVNNN